jgi:hypothetical protein
MMAAIYISGPVSGHEDKNAPAFDAATKYYRTLGHAVFNPLEKPEENDNLTYRQYMIDDIDWLMRHADAIVMLPKWEYSRGATAEHALAIALALPITYWSDHECRPPESA